MAAVQPRTLDTDLKQVLVYYPGDANGFFYHHRVLVVPGPDGKWIGLSPDHDVLVVDLLAQAEHLVPLRRASDFPTFVPPNQIYAFDPFASRQEEDRLREECREDS